jgi:hypothetical protein
MLTREDTQAICFLLDVHDNVFLTDTRKVIGRNQYYFFI